VHELRVATHTRRAKMAGKQAKSCPKGLPFFTEPIEASQRFQPIGLKPILFCVCEIRAQIVGKLDDKIKFLDVRHDIPRIMSASDVFVLPSLWEGLGMVSVEAQCSGMKVIMSRTIPKEAIICNDLVTIKSIDEEPEDWSNAIATIALDDNRTKYAGEIRKSPFSIENSVDRLIGLYES